MSGIKICLTLLLIFFMCNVASAGNVIDNTKTITVYVPSSYNMAYTGVYYEPIFTAMFPEYNLQFVNDTTIKQITPLNCDLLLVGGGTKTISSDAITTINSYISAGGKVWFFKDTGSVTVLNTGTLKEVTIAAKANLKVVNTDPITKGMSATIASASTIKQTNVDTRKFSKTSGTSNGFTYQSLITDASGDSLMAKYTTANGAKILYSNPELFISGGQGDFFSQAVATKLFLNAKAWILGLDSNTNEAQITYPNGDKQLALTWDDVYAGDDSSIYMPTFVSLEEGKGLTPANVNTFFIMPETPSMALENTAMQKANLNTLNKMLSANDMSINSVSQMPTDTTGTTRNGLTYMAQYGDTNTLHPHFITEWRDETPSISTFMDYLNQDENIINNVMGIPNYGFTSFRFPHTYASTNATLAMIDSGFQVDSTFGQASWNGLDGDDTGNIGDTITNNVFFAKQNVLNGAKTNLVELETPALFDYSAGTGAKWYNSNKAEMPYWKNINFPSVYVVSGHWFLGMTQTSFMNNGLSKIIDEANTMKDSTTTFAQLNSYLKALSSATITATTTGNGVTANVNCPVAIKGFTIKSGSKITSVKVNGLSNGEITHDGNNYYATVDLAIGSNTIVVS
jgi:hypothetical protein